MAYAEEIRVKLPDGQILSIDVDYNETIGSLVNEVQSYCYEASYNNQLPLYDFSSANCLDEKQTRALDIRDYWQDPTAEEIEAIRFVVLTLGNQSLLKLYRIEPQLHAAGNKIDNVHPLNVWRIIFSQDDTICAMYNIKKRKVVWKSFMKGMAESLQEEHDRNNINHDYIVDFASKVKIDPIHIQSELKSSKWNDFVKQLISHVERSNSGDRYDM